MRQQQERSKLMKLTLKAIRANSNLTQYQAGKAVGVSKDVWRNWEIGKTLPNALQIQEIEKKFNIAFSDIIF